MTVYIEDVAHERVFVSELEPGMIDSFGLKVMSVERITDDRTRVEWEDGEIQTFGHADTTILIEAASINEEE